MPNIDTSDDSFMEQLVHEIMQAKGKVLFLLSQHSVESPWTEDVAKLVLDRELALRRNMLVPILVNDLTISVEKRWHKHMIQQMAIIDLVYWKSPAFYAEGLKLVLKELKFD